eukprot:TRINITY_DN5130_c0_g1_i6.p1 TRINITY_DN5130_c0_g1~~TRINITY_DN5130_c0_g1_i6.p1  ORF type:complete len:350 (+),score=60.02 TRINITY_DN5130_c0_g1_i6:109-1050(+)
MPDDDGSILVSCQDTCLIVKTSLLFKESPVMRAMLGSNWRCDTLKESKEIVQGTSIRKIYEITDYDPKSVEIVFRYLQDCSCPLKNMQDIRILEDALQLCDFYHIMRPLEAIVTTMQQVPVTMDNVVSVFEMSQRLGMISLYKDLAASIALKCRVLARVNLCTMPLIIKFLSEHEDKLDVAKQIVKITKIEGYDSVCRFTLKDEMDKSTYFISGMEFTVQKTKSCRGGTALHLQYRGSPVQQWTTVNLNCCKLYQLKDGKLELKRKHSHWHSHAVIVETEVNYVEFLFNSGSLTKTPQVAEDMVVVHTTPWTF